MARAKGARRQARAEVRKLADLVQREIEAGATTVEEIHKAIADLPLEILERLDLFEATVKDVRKVQDTSIGAIYDLIRRINREVSSYAKELLEQRAARRSAKKPAQKKP
jgi:hypothetical protein